MVIKKVTQSIANTVHYEHVRFAEYAYDQGTYVAHRVVWTVSRGKEEWCTDSSAVGDGDRDSCSQRRSSRPRNCGCAVRKERHDGRVGASDQEDCYVAADPVAHKGQKQVSSSNENKTHECVANTLFGVIGVHTVTDDDEKTKDIGRHSQQLCSIA